MDRELITVLAGFTIIASIILAVAYLFFLPEMRKSLPSKLACTLMLLILCLQQWAHYQYFNTGFDALGSRTYLFLLLLAPPSFYFFARSVIYTEPGYSWIQLLHLIWPAMAVVLPIGLIPLVAFMVGTAYTIWFVSIVWGMREQRTHFHFELFFFTVFALMALVALIAVLALPYVDPSLFYLVFGTSIGLAVMLVVGALIVFPDLVSEIMLITDLAYSRSKLASIDVAAARARLEKLMDEEHIYQNEELNLGLLAELIEITPHQLSELINSANRPRFSSSF